MMMGYTLLLYIHYCIVIVLKLYNITNYYHMHNIILINIIIITISTNIIFIVYCYYYYLFVDLMLLP